MQFIIWVYYVLVLSLPRNLKTVTPFLLLLFLCFSIFLLVMMVTFVSNVNLNSFIYIVTDSGFLLCENLTF